MVDTEGVNKIAIIYYGMTIGILHINCFNSKFEVKTVDMEEEGNIFYMITCAF